MDVVKAISSAIFCFIAAAETAGGAVTVAPLPAPEFDDTEVATISVQLGARGLREDRHPLTGFY